MCFHPAPSMHSSDRAAVDAAASASFHDERREMHMKTIWAMGLMLVGAGLVTEVQAGGPYSGGGQPGFYYSGTYGTLPQPIYFRTSTANQGQFQSVAPGRSQYIYNNSSGNFIQHGGRTDFYSNYPSYGYGRYGRW
jgi:hypothetical protein